MKSVLLILCYTMIFGIYQVPSHLLAPDAPYKSLIVINRLAFGLHLPFIKRSILQWDFPHNNDLILLTTESGKNLIRYVIAQPREEFMFNGKRVVVPDGKVLVGLPNQNIQQNKAHFGFVPIKNVLGKSVFMLK